MEKENLNNSPVESDAKSPVGNAREKNSQVDDQESKDFVKYETYKKTVNQLKNYKQELEGLRAFKQQAEEAEMVKKGDYEKLLASRDQKISELQAVLDDFENDKIIGKKGAAFIKKLGANLKKEEYWRHVSFDDIQMNPETGDVDELSLEREVNRFKNEFGTDLLVTASGPSVPNIGHLGGKPNAKKSLKDMSREQIRQLYLNLK